uniref:Uncharacterized protein n=1 Tax=Manihot esculenta TaxID=3983 RepID=A0A2C9V5Y0_MANES
MSQIAIASIWMDKFPISTLEALRRCYADASRNFCL